MKLFKVNLINFLSGITVGLVFAVAAMVVLMPKLMIVTHESKYNTVEETCEVLQRSIKDNGWVSPAIRDMNMSTQKHGVQLDKKVRLVELCKAQYAKDVLTTNPEVSTLMPCAWGVYEGDDGKVYISGMNMGLMGKLFGGNIAKIMGGNVAKDERNMLREVL